MIPKEFQCPDCDGEGKYWVEDDSPGAGGYARNCKSCNQTGLKLVKISAMELDALRNSITALADAVRERDEARGYVQRISNMTGFRCTNEDCPAVQAHIYINGLRKVTR